MTDEPTIITNPDAGQPHWPTITGFTPIKPDNNRVAVQVDGKRAVVLPVLLVGDLGLAVGTHWDQSVISRVHEAHGQQKRPWFPGTHRWADPSLRFL